VAKKYTQNFSLNDEIAHNTAAAKREAAQQEAALQRSNLNPQNVDYIMASIVHNPAVIAKLKRESPLGDFASDVAIKLY